MGDPGGNMGGGEEGSWTGGVPVLLSPSLRFIPNVICLVAVDIASLALAPTWDHE